MRARNHRRAAIGVHAGRPVKSRARSSVGVGQLARGGVGQGRTTSAVRTKRRVRSSRRALDSASDCSSTGTSFGGPSKAFPAVHPRRSDALLLFVVREYAVVGRARRGPIYLWRPGLQRQHVGASPADYKRDYFPKKRRREPRTPKKGANATPTSMGIRKPNCQNESLSSSPSPRRAGGGSAAAAASRTSTGCCVASAPRCCPDS